MYKINDFQIIEPLLKENRIANLNALGRIRNNSNVDVYIDNVCKPKGFVLIDEWWVSMYSKHEEVIVKMINDVKLPNYIQFCGLPMPISTAIKESIKGYKLKWELICNLYYLPKKKNEEILEIEEFGSLTSKNFDFISENYDYYEKETEDYLLDCIVNRPSSVIFDKNNTPISWALVREDGSLGILNTVKEHRGKGLAQKVTVDLMRKMLEKGRMPYMHVTLDNYASIKSALKSGLVYWDKILWFAMVKE
ncbi:MAG: GNAT family N-acetyltransferase [Alkaliphilus sp.]